MNEWPIVPIGDVAEVFDGPHATPKTVSEGPIFLGISSLQNGRINLGDTRHVTPDVFKKWTRRVKPMRDDVVFSYETRLGEAAIIPEGLECCLGRRMGLVRADRSRLNPRFFLYYYLSPTFQDFLRSRTIHGATVDRIALKEFPSFPVPVPPLQEQLEIANLLGSLDDKIELNRRMNETLEAMAQAIFRDWFVDFGPTRRKIDGTTDPVEIMGGLVNDPDRARELADLFPARLGDDGLPEGWSYSSLGEVFDIKIGRTPPRKEQQHFTSAGDGVPWMSIRDMGECGVFIRDTAEGLTPDAVERFRVPVINPDTVVVSFKLTVGRVAITEGHMLSNEAIAHLGPGSQAQSPWFTYLWMQQFDYSRLGSTSSIATAVNSKSIKTIEFPVVGPTLRSAFHDLVDPVFRMIRSKSNEGRNLAATRDLLLPKLMSGEIRLRAAEAVLEAAQ